MAAEACEAASESPGSAGLLTVRARLSSRLRWFITMETLSGPFNGGKEVSSLAFLTHTHTHTQAVFRSYNRL